VASTQLQQWMPREQWDALVRGENCPLCAEAASTNPINEHGYTVADLTFSRLRLASNQSVPGYCILICKTHVREPYELTVQHRSAFFEDMMRAGSALEKVLDAIKMNFEILGNAVPHLHCHIKPRYYGDRAPSRPIHVEEQEVFLSPEEAEKRVAAIRAAL
jgi:diadenosine tetraphosphate (Ap4A) HIT family hydrolase